MSMKTHNIAALLMESCKTVSVTFEVNLKNSTAYVYKTVLDLEFGDSVVVNVSGKLKIATVTEIHKVPRLDMDSQLEYKWIIQKVDTTKYDELLKLESEFQDTLMEIVQQDLREKAIDMLRVKLGSENTNLASAVKKLNFKG